MYDKFAPLNFPPETNLEKLLYKTEGSFSVNGLLAEIRNLRDSGKLTRSEFIIVFVGSRLKHMERTGVPDERMSNIILVFNDEQLFNSIFDGEQNDDYKLSS